MEIREKIHEMGVKARAAAAVLARLSCDSKNQLLVGLAQRLEGEQAAIRAANERDVARAKASGLKDSLVDRLTLTEGRFRQMVDGVRHVASLPDPVGEELWRRERPSGILIRKVRVPIGVIAVVFESRPNVFIDTAALCLKTGNAVILRGGKEAIETNKALARVTAEALGGLGASEGLADSVQLIDILDHGAVTELVRAVGLVDVAIPRGGERLIRAMCEAALIPVLKHYKGVCHVYVDGEADLEMALAILDNAKTQRTGVCNAAECLLVAEAAAERFLPMVCSWAKEKGVTLHDDGAGVEYLSLDLNVARVADCRAAVAYINANGSHHSDCIVTDNAATAGEFLRDVDSACVYHNASTRFTDGGEFGMGAEIGISTDKLHARGPMGLEELTTYKYLVTGDGTVRK